MTPDTRRDAVSQTVHLPGSRMVCTPPSAVAVGLAGTGKTALATEFAHCAQ